MESWLVSFVMDRIVIRDLYLGDGDLDDAAAWLHENDIVRLNHASATDLNWHAGKRGLYLEEGDEGEWHVKKL